MRIDWAFKRRALAGHDALVDSYPDKEFNSPWRSTIPLVEFWRSPEKRVRELSHSLGLVVPTSVRLGFEHTVSPPRGRGKASHTDVMVASSQFVLAIEAKWTEPRYEVVGDWLGDSTNRAEVLRGWCDLLQQRTTDRVDANDLATLPYQMVHRAASACDEAGPESNCWLVYMVFNAEGNSLRDCRADLRGLRQALGPGSSLGIALAECSVDQSNVLLDLQGCWSKGARALAKPVRESLRSGGVLLASLERVHLLASAAM